MTAGDGIPSSSSAMRPPPGPGIATAAGATRRWTRPDARPRERLAHDLAAGLAPGTRIVSSPLVRALATAEAIARAAGSGPVVVDGRWRETDVGTAEGRTFEELSVLEPELAARLAAGDPAIDWPGGETASALARPRPGGMGGAADRSVGRS